MSNVKWIQKIQDKKVSKDQRSHNSSVENDLLDEAQEQFEYAKTCKVDYNNQPLNNKFMDIDKTYRGDQWRTSVPSYKSTPVLNFIFSLIESEVPRMTDSNPDLLVYPRYDPESGLLAEELSRTQKYLWFVNDMKEQIEDAARMCFKYGTVFFKAAWDESMTDGLGDVRYSVIHPMNFYPDPRSYKINEMEFCFVDVPRSLEYFCRKWKDKGHLVVPDNLSTDDEEGKRKSSLSADSAALREYTFRDEDGNVCIMYYAGDLVLDIIGGKYDGSNKPIYKHNKFPFSRFVNYPLDKEFWGMGEVELVEVLQRLINSFEAQIIDNTRLMANAQWIINKMQSGITEEKAWVLNSRPGAAIFTNNGGVEKAKGEAIPSHVMDHMERLITAMEQILGIHDVVQGRRPGGLRAASAIIALQESANIRIRMKASHLERALEDICSQANWLVLENYDSERRVRIGRGETPITLNVRDALVSRMLNTAQEQGLMGAEEGMISPNATPQNILPEEQDTLMQEVKFPDFDLEVKIGPSVPYSQALLYEQAKEFYSLGLIDRKAVLDLTNFPNKEEIMQRMAEQERAVAEAEAAAQKGERVGERY